MKIISSAGSEYALVPGSNIVDRLPKRFVSSLELTVDGSPLSLPVTENRAFAGTERALFYPWILVAGRAYYATLTAEEFEAFPAAEYTVADGKASRPDPKRLTSRVEAEASRIAAFRATYAANRADVVESDLALPVRRAIDDFAADAPVELSEGDLAELAELAAYAAE